MEDYREKVIEFLEEIEVEIISSKRNYIIFSNLGRTIVGKFIDDPNNLDSNIIVELNRSAYKCQIDRIVHFINGSETIVQKDKNLKKEITNRGAENFFFYEDYLLPNSILAPTVRIAEKNEALPNLPKIPKTDRLIKKGFFEKGDIVVFERRSRLPGLICPLSLQPFVVV